jgi:hypothetical protein
MCCRTMTPKIAFGNWCLSDGKATAGETPGGRRGDIRPPASGGAVRGAAASGCGSAVGLGVDQAGD